MDWWNSHGRFMTFQEMLYIEVDDRENYTLEEVQSWAVKYNIRPKTLVIWGASYQTAKEYGYGEEPVELPPDLTPVIESDDGDGGFLLFEK